MSDAKALEKQREMPADKAPAGGPKTGGVVQPPGEVNGPKGPEPTRFGDWEVNGRCSDF